ncbi:hypothetical protein [Streptomyces sp. NPDC001927]
MLPGGCSGHDPDARGRGSELLALAGGGAGLLGRGALLLRQHAIHRAACGNGQRPWRERVIRPAAGTTRPRGSTRPGARRAVRRRPTPIIPIDRGASQFAVLAYVQHLCETVLRSNDIDTLADFAAD